MSNFCATLMYKVDMTARFHSAYSINPVPTSSDNRGATDVLVNKKNSPQSEVRL